MVGCKILAKLYLYQSLRQSARTSPKGFYLIILDGKSTKRKCKYLTTQAPPATVFPHPLQCQIPTHFLFKASCKKQTKSYLHIQTKNVNSKQQFLLQKTRIICWENTGHEEQHVYNSYSQLRTKWNGLPPFLAFLFSTREQKKNITLTLPQKTHVYFACCVISIFLTIFRSEAPYRVPYFPTTPTFLVLFAYMERRQRNQAEFNQNSRK